VFVVVREERAVRGVGAPIWDFLGVSITGLLLLALTADVINDFAVPVRGLGFFVRRPAAINGCRIAACGFIRRSGSQIKHLDMKSTNSSSLQRKTCARVLVPGRLLRPLEFITTRGAPLESMDTSLAEKS
jgi:hypothetical protein